MTKSKWVLSLLGVVLATVLVLGVRFDPATSAVTWEYPLIGGISTGDIFYGYAPSHLRKLAAGTSGYVLKSGGANTAPSWGEGGTTSTTEYAWIPATRDCTDVLTNNSASNSLIPQRVAANDWVLGRTSGSAETHTIACDLNSWLERIGSSKGVKLTKLDLVYQIPTGTDLTGATWGKLVTRVFASGVANAISADIATTPTMPTASAANPYVVAVSIPSGSQAYRPAASQTNLNLEFSVGLAASQQFRFYGVGATYSRLDH